VSDAHAVCLTMAKLTLGTAAALYLTVNQSRFISGDRTLVQRDFDDVSYNYILVKIERCLSSII
jgi:hypothetical protein